MSDQWVPVVTLIIGLMAAPVTSAIGFIIQRRFTRHQETVTQQRQALSELQTTLLQLAQVGYSYHRPSGPNDERDLSR